MDFVCKKCGCTEYYEYHEGERLRKRCKDCHTARMRKIYATPEYKAKHREDDRKRRRNCRSELYNRLQDEQQGKCAICKKEIHEDLRADHDYATGEMRGLLCDNCNWGLGNFKDNIGFLNNAIEYLKKYQKG